MIRGPRCVEELGFTLHANTCAGALDERGRQALLEYVLRPPIANENVQQGAEGLVRIVLKRPFSDGTTRGPPASGARWGGAAVEMDPLSLLCRLAATRGPQRAKLVGVARCRPRACTPFAIAGS